MKSFKTSVRKGSRTDRQTSPAPEFLGEVDRCPECGHAWNDLGPVHFADCRFFWEESERDEDTIILRDEWNCLSHEAA
jgi:hypothetical protein